MILYTQNRRQITIEDSSFRSGGQGTIHHVLSSTYNQPMVVKLYLTPQKALAAQQRIEYMSKNNPFTNAQQKIQDAFVWPIDPLYDSNSNFVGFIMCLINDSYPLWHLTTSKGFTDSAWVKYNISDPNSYNTRLRILYNASQALDVLDQSNYYKVVDLKPDNIMLKNDGHLVIIDCDSFQIAQGKHVSFHAGAATEEYCPPEFHNGKIDFTNQAIESSWDYFSFGVTAYQILFCIHPFNATHFFFKTQVENIKHDFFANGRNKGSLQVIPPPHNNFNTLLSKPLQNLFMRCFDDGYSKPNARPNFTEWRDGFLNEIYRLKNLNISAGTNQPRPKPLTPTQVPNVTPLQTVLQPQPQCTAVVNTFTITPGGINKAVLSWDVSQAVQAYVNGISVGLIGTMQIPAVDSSFQLDAIDVQGIKTTKFLNFKVPVEIKQFDYQVCNGHIQLIWDVNGANNITIDQNVVTSRGSLQIPLAIGPHTLVATDNTGYILAQNTYINTLVAINDFHINLNRTSAELEWEVWNASEIRINGVVVNNTKDKKSISLQSDIHAIGATDAFGNTVTSNQTLNVATQVRIFNILNGKFTSCIFWDLWYVQKARLNGEIISLLQGSKTIPFITKDYTLELTDFNGVITIHTQQLIAPNKIALQPVQPMDDSTLQLKDARGLSDLIVRLYNTVDLSDLIVSLEKPSAYHKEPVELQNVNVQLNHLSLQYKNTSLLNVHPVSMDQNISVMHEPVSMKSPVSRRDKPQSQNQISDLLSKAAALIGFILSLIK